MHNHSHSDIYNQGRAPADLWAVSLCLAAVCTGSAWAASPQDHSHSSRLQEVRQHIPAEDIEVALGLTGIYQQNTHGGVSTRRRAGRLAGSYDVQVTAGLERLLGIESASLFAHAEGFWPRAQGIDGPSVGSFSGVNADAQPRDALILTELWYEQGFGDTFTLRAGKMDLTGGFECGGTPVAFDASLFANDETSQFLNGALVNNPTIPFPIYALGVSSLYRPTERLYAAAGIVDAQADMRQTGLRTAFRDEDYFFGIFETGLTPVLDSPAGPLQGAYRFGFWYDPQPKAHSDSTRAYRDDLGFYTSCDQMLWRETADPQDFQGLGLFFRFGAANGLRNDVTRFWSAGFQYQGLFDGRDADVLGVGVATSTFTNRATATFAQDHETVLEVYYRIEVCPHLSISPDIQYLKNPGGTQGVADATVLGLRAQFTF